MGNYWLHDLPDALAAWNIDFDLYPGWELRSRSSGGYDSLMGIGTHHTASFTAPQNDKHWLWGNPGNRARPVGALYLARSGNVTLGAAGATNTQGRGGPVTGSKGTVPLNAGNRHLISIEAANNGNGEVWPAEQVEAYLRLCACLCETYDFDAMRDIWTHHVWAPGRKVDPRGPTPSHPSIGGSDGVDLWNDNNFRALTLDLMVPTPPTSSTPTLGAPMQTRTLSAPYRIYDSRRYGGHLSGGTTTPIDVSAVDLFNGAKAVAVNVTVIDATEWGFLTVWGTGAVPDASCVNYDGVNVKTAAGFTITSLDWAGRFHVFNHGRCHVAVDVVSVFTPLTQ